MWLEDFSRDILTPEQQREKITNQKASAFRSYLLNNYGGLDFIMGVWEMGMPWLPSKEMLEATDPTGALEHVTKHFTKWVECLAKAFQWHKDDDDTREARDRSSFHHRFGQTQHEKEVREEKQRCWSYISWAQKLEQELFKAKGQGKAKGKGIGKSGAKSTQWKPHTYAEMTQNEKKNLNDY